MCSSGGQLIRYISHLTGIVIKVKYLLQTSFLKLFSASESYKDLFKIHIWGPPSLPRHSELLILSRAKESTILKTHFRQF